MMFTLGRVTEKKSRTSPGLEHGDKNYGAANLDLQSNSAEHKQEAVTDQTNLCLLLEAPTASPFTRHKLGCPIFSHSISKEDCPTVRPLDPQFQTLGWLGAAENSVLPIRQLQDTHPAAA